MYKSVACHSYQKQRCPYGIHEPGILICLRGICVSSLSPTLFGYCAESVAVSPRLRNASADTAEKSEQLLARTNCRLPHPQGPPDAVSTAEKHEEFLARTICWLPHLRRLPDAALEGTKGVPTKGGRK